MINSSQALLFPPPARPSSVFNSDELEREIDSFSEFGRESERRTLIVSGWGDVPVFVNEFWTAKQRAASSLHEVSYRACFKPQLPRFFIERLTDPGDIVYDPFMGRGTTLIEAALLNRTPYGCDINPLSQILVGPRLAPPHLADVQSRLGKIDFGAPVDLPGELMVFYHPKTLEQICALRNYLLTRQCAGDLDPVDLWIWMVACNRLTGHSSGFFSVYTLPPNQAVSVDAQRKINQKLGQSPPPRNVPQLILKKTRQLLRDVDDSVRLETRQRTKASIILTGSSDRTPQITSNSVTLSVTSPPFLDTVDYEQDNWLRAWFCGIDLSKVPIWQIRSLDEWRASMCHVMREVRRVLRPAGWLAFEVGEVRNGGITLENSALEAGIEAGLRPVLVLINKQSFTKTSNCWGVKNLTKGTNTNRIVLFQK